MLAEWWKWLRDATHKNGQPRKPPERLLAALEHIQTSGSVRRWVPDRAQRVALMTAMMNERLVEWDMVAARYELTPLGQQWLSEYQKQPTSELPAVSGL
jgi:hypothetical protein